MAKRGRPSAFTAELGDEICARVSDGEPLMAICRDKGIAWRTVYDWLKANEDFSAGFARAREIGYDAIAAECLEIANSPMVGITETDRGDGKIEIRREDMLGHRKLMIETRLKLLAKWDPKRYGEKIESTHKGDPLAPISLVLSGSDVHG